MVPHRMTDQAVLHILRKRGDEAGVAGASPFPVGVHGADIRVHGDSRNAIFPQLDNRRFPVAVCIGVRDAEVVKKR
jgi:hypothetical protein